MPPDAAFKATAHSPLLPCYYVVEAACADRRVRTLAITGAGGNFYAGGDVRLDRAREQAAEVDLVLVVQDVFNARRHGDKPSVAAVQGNTRGVGLALMLACDLAVAAQFTRMSLVPDMGMSITLPNAWASRTHAK